MTRPSASFATFLIVCPTAFVLGLLFSFLPYDYPLLYTSAPPPPEAFDRLEAHLSLLADAPPLVARLLHIILSLGFIGLLLKLYKPSESNMLFDGASLVLYTIATAMYISNIVKGLQFIPSVPTTASDGDSVGAAAMKILSSVTSTPSPSAGIAKDAEDPGLFIAALTGNIGTSSSVTWTGREESLRVYAASNAILSLVLCGVLVLQAGQWYAERKEAQELRVIRDQERVAKKESREGLRSPGIESRKTR